MVSVTAAALAGTTAPVALAADDCANAAVRAQQSASHLPGCLAYERVSPADKNGAAASARPAIRQDGNALLFAMNSGLADSQGFIVGNYRADRGADGWSTTALSPPFFGRTPILVDSPSITAWSSDLSRVAVETRYPVAPKDVGTVGAPSNNGSYDVYVRDTDGSFTWVHPDPATGDAAGQPVSALGGSPDLDRVVVGTARPFDARGAGVVGEHLYVWSKQRTLLASVLPDGSVPTQVPVTISNEAARAVSADGRRIAFTVADGGRYRLYVRFNADDPATAVTREVAVGPNGEACDTNGARPLAGFSNDGSKVLFYCASQILPEGPASGALYLRDLDGGASAVRLMGSATGGTRIFGANDDFSRIYLQGINASADVYLVRDGVAERIATPISPPTQTAFFRTAASPSGEYFVFQSQFDFGLPGVHPGTSSDYQVYRYSASTREILCVSCRQDGSVTDGEGGFQLPIPGISSGEALTPVGDNGAVAFGSTTALDPADTNGIQDAYAWFDGRQVLLSGGRNAEPSTISGTALGGTAIVFTTPESLVPDDRDGGSYDVYMARADGGYLLPDPPTVCTTNCQTPGPGVSNGPSVGTQDFLGRGNLVEETTQAAPRATASLTASRSVKGSSTTVRVKVSRAGTIRVSGNGLRRTTARAAKAGTYRVTVRLSAYGAAQQRKRGRLVTKVTARLTPESGASAQARRTVTFTAAKKGGR